MSILYGKNTEKFIADSARESIGVGSVVSSKKEISNTTTPSNKSLSKGQKINVGDTRVTVTDPYGIRDFEGRKGKHSTGIDMVTNTGKAIALQDCTIESVKTDWKTDVYTPTTKDDKGEQLKGSGGYYVTVKNADGTRAQYMHLNQMTSEEMKKLEGKKLKRGEGIWVMT